MNELSRSPQETMEALWTYHAGPMPSAPDSGDLEALAEQFIELKQHLGHRYHRDGGYVRDVLRFLKTRGIHRAADLSTEAITTWARSRAHVHPLTWTREVGALSVFMDHLKALGQIPNNPCTFLRRRCRSAFRPYIFSTQELQRIFAPAHQGGPAQDRAVLYRVLYACALRVSEGTRLRLQDFHPEQSTLFIQKSKFNKERLLPLHPTVQSLLRAYRDRRRASAPPGETLFVNGNGHPHRPSALSHHFLQDLKRLALYRPTHEADGVRYGSPRLHALRHSFAVHRLLQWYREGADVQAKLPLLSTYLGHSKVEYTQVYLKVTGLMLKEGHGRFAREWEKEFPLAP